MGSKKNTTTEPAPSPSAKDNGVIRTIDIPIASIRIPKDKTDRTRNRAFEEYVAELAANIGQCGLINPITVHPEEDETYTLIAGECRLEAFKSLGRNDIPASLVMATDQIEDIRIAENLQRLDYDDEQKAVQIGGRLGEAEDRIHAEMGVADASKLDAPAADAVRRRAIREVAGKLGWPESRVRDYAFIGELPKATRELAGEGRLSVPHLRVLAQVSDPKRCDELAEEYAAGVDRERQPMGSLKDLERDVHRELANLAKVAWKLDVPFAGAPACTVCPHNSKNRAGLFEGAGKGFANGESIDFAKADAGDGVCLKLACFRGKNNATKTAIRNAGDRIAGKAPPTGKPKPEWKGEAAALVRSAQEKASFVNPTVFGREVKARIEAKLEKPKGKAKSDRGITHSHDDYNSPENKAKRAWEEATFQRNRTVGDLISKRISKLDPKRVALIKLHVCESPEAFNIFEWDSDQSVKDLTGLVNRMRLALDGDPEAVLMQAGRELAKEFNFFDSLVAGYSTLGLKNLCEMLGVEGVPELPKLENFQPKKEPAKPAEKTKMSPPAKAKGGKPAPGKKKAKKSKMPAAASPAAASDDASDELDQD